MAFDPSRIKGVVDHYQPSVKKNLISRPKTMSTHLSVLLVLTFILKFGYIFLDKRNLFSLLQIVCKHVGKDEIGHRADQLRL
jgi:hypothetical protein